MTLALTLLLVLGVIGLKLEIFQPNGSLVRWDNRSR